MSYFNKLFKVLGIFFLALSGINSQSVSDFELLKSSIDMTSPIKVRTTEQFKENLSNNGGEIQIITTSLFFVYKEFFSSQDFNSCVFYPSCSVYGIESLKSNGLIKGGIRTFDRLSRCNGFNANRYSKDMSKQLLLDPVKH